MHFEKVTNKNVLRKTNQLEEIGNENGNGHRFNRLHECTKNKRNICQWNAIKFKSQLAFYRTQLAKIKWICVQIVNRIVLISGQFRWGNLTYISGIEKTNWIHFDWIERFGSNFNAWHQLCSFYLTFFYAIESIWIENLISHIIDYYYWFVYVFKWNTRTGHFIGHPFQNTRFFAGR